MRAKSVLTLIGFSFCALLFVGQARADGALGQLAPDLAAPTLDGKSFDLAALKGKVVIVNFWATWCAPCREELPALEAVWRHYHGQGLEMIAISADRPRARDDVAQVAHYFTFPIALMGSASKNDFGTPSIIPTTYVVGKDGNIANILTPDVTPVTEQGLGETVKALLVGKSDAKPADKADDKSGDKPDSKADLKADTKS